MKKEDIEKLPKWAQQEIQILEQNLSQANAELLRLKENPESNTVVGFYPPLPHTQQAQFLKNNQLISFILPLGRITARIERDVLHINANTDGEIAVRPQTSNALELKLYPRV